MDKFKVGEGVTVTEGPFKNIYGIIIMFDKTENKYLVRFTGNQQLFYSEDKIIYWGK